jgi:hypothetical protein
VIAPVLVFKLAPPGSAPDCTPKVVAFVAATVKLIVPAADTVPKLPAAVVHAGASDTVSKAVPDLVAIPSLFSSLKKYVPSTDIVNVATTVVAFVNDTESAVIIAPVDALIASTKGGVELSLKFVPVIVIAVCVFSITPGLIDEIVGNVTLSEKDNVPDPFVEITWPLVPSVAGSFKNTPVLIVDELWLRKLPMLPWLVH